MRSSADSEPSRSRPLTWPIRHAVVTVLGAVVRPILTTKNMKRLKHIPSGPAIFRARYKAPRVWWARIDEADVPADLLTIAGIRRDAKAEQAAYDKEPLHSFDHTFGAAVVWSLARLWESVVPVGPRLIRSVERAKTTGGEPAATPQARSGADWTEWMRRNARAIGLSTVGVAAYEPKYTFVEHLGENAGNQVIVCILEQKWEPTQTLPGPVGEQTALSTNSEVTDMASDLAFAIEAAGYRARAHSTEGVAVVHHYAVEAGLGQLGINGQLLTPHAGSRCRIAMVTTDMPLVIDGPRDYGIPAICDACKACVRRCPAGAIPNKRTMYRGVEKAKLNLGRCFPVVAKVNGCSVCMKVCPVQRYGLPRIYEHWKATGEVFGTGTDELEGYDWPLDGRHYGPGERPELAPSFFKMDVFPLNPDGSVRQVTHREHASPLM